MRTIVNLVLPIGRDVDHKNVTIVGLARNGTAAFTPANFLAMAGKEIMSIRI